MNLFVFNLQKREEIAAKCHKCTAFLERKRAALEIVRIFFKKSILNQQSHKSVPIQARCNNAFVTTAKITRICAIFHWGDMVQSLTLYK